MKTIIIKNDFENIKKLENFFYDNLLNFEIINTKELNFKNSSFLRFTLIEI